MPRELWPEDVLKALKNGRLEPCYLFYGPGEFRLEKVLDTIRNTFIPEGARDLNTEIVYLEKGAGTSDIINRARSLPFLGRCNSPEP